MIVKWIIIGIFLIVTTPTFSQITLRRNHYMDSLLLALDTTRSNYQVNQITKELLLLVDTNSIDRNLFRVYRKRGVSLFQSGKYLNSLTHLQAANRIAHQLQKPSLINQSLHDLDRLETTFKKIHNSLTFAEVNSFKSTQILGVKRLSATFERMNAPDSALSYLKACMELQDALLQEELYVAYQTQKARNESADQKKEIDTLKQERRLNYLSSFFIILLLILALIVSSFFVVRNRMKRKLAESELRNQKLVSEQIRRELEGKQKDLTKLALEIARKNELFLRTNEMLAEIPKSNLVPEQQKKIENLIQYNANQLRINEDLEELFTNIEQVSADFFEKLTELIPDLTPAERQLCALLRLNLGTKDIASIRNISPKSVEMARYRLRKKLPAEAGNDIYAFIQKI